ncbi:phosphoribosylglycinamide formyltransferase [Anseongella ginsenosidimutans]|nr:phosphoribosylglycinamide formyltransferase [Anseongella ginsenosidimutans]QEC51058.1 phosphoribosylglycinamide formyltransferase [Anseongella ginsenosidimutans]
MTRTKRIAIFASGSGSNAQKIIEHFKDSSEAEVTIILSNRPDAYVLERADNHEIPTHVFDREEFYHSARVVTLLQNLEIDLVVLAGFLWLIPQNMLEAFPGRIVNIHPALLPKYGGQGMYGDRVHKAIMSAGERESGITIHYVDEVYDAGDVIYQAHFKIEPNDNLDMIKYKGQQLEHLHYPRIIENLLKKL